MEMDINPLSMSAMCVGCLSSDRKLKILSNENAIIFFQEFLECFDSSNKSVTLCWECTALLQKSVQFKKQVKYSNEYLMTYAYNHTPIPSLSKLKVHETQHIDITEDTRKEKKSRKSKNTQSSESQDFIKSDIVVSNLNILETLKKDSSIHSKAKNDSVPNEWQVGTQEIVKIDSDTLETKNNDSFVQKYEVGSTFEDIFVKTEDNSLDMAVDGFFDSENLDEGVTESFNGIENVDGSTVKVVYKRKKRKKDVTYNDSDDEPLVKKKEKKKSKRVKETDGLKLDRRRNPGPRREKPSGVVTSARVDSKLRALNVPRDQLEMVLLSWQEVEEERQRSLQSETFTRHDYRCYDCVIGFNYRVKLENHMLKHQPSAGGLVCEVCKIYCKNAHALSAHRRRHRVRWRCRQCGGTWSRAAVAADHSARAHGAPPPAHVCSACGHSETSLGRLRNHMKNHSERQKCELCEKTFRNKDSLRTHLFIHRGEKEHACPACGKRFLFKRALRVHLVTHDAPALLYCHECDVNFKNSMSYGQHMRYSLKHVDPAKLKHACGDCGKRFLKAARLLEHRLAVHLKATPFRCAAPACEFASSSRAVLRSHARATHAGGRARRDYVCHACGKAYKNKKTLEGHLRAHAGERPLRCALCPAAFAYDAALYNHTRAVHRAARASQPPAAEQA